LRTTVLGDADFLGDVVEGERRDVKGYCLLFSQDQHPLFFAVASVSAIIP
jgi:hypothetical protein